MRTFIYLCLLLFTFTLTKGSVACGQTIHGNIPEKVNISEKKVKSILRKQGFSRIKIIEIDYEIFENKKVYEVDFKYRGKLYEAAISLEHKFIYSALDIDD